MFDDGRDNVIGMGCQLNPGPNSDQCSYRSELFGMYLSLLIVQQICQKYKLQSGGITIGCDNICRRFGMSCEGACSYTSMWQLLSGLNSWKAVEIKMV